jgi:hypothetical protein
MVVVVREGKRKRKRRKKGSEEKRRREEEKKKRWMLSMRLKCGSGRDTDPGRSFLVIDCIGSKRQRRCGNGGRNGMCQCPCICPDLVSIST